MCEEGFCLLESGSVNGIISEGVCTKCESGCSLCYAKPLGLNKYRQICEKCEDGLFLVANYDGSETRCVEKCEDGHFG